MKKSIIMLMVLFAAAAGSYASLSLNITSDNVTFDGATDYANGDYFMYLIDVNGDGIEAPTDIAFNPGADDYLVADGEAVYMDMDGFRGYTWTTTKTLDFATYANKDVYLVAFDGITSADSAPGAGTDYVIWRDAAMTLPGSDGGSLTGNYTLTPGTATFAQTVPEPATALFGLIGAGVAYAGRRAKRFYNYEA
jgi:hypothetical protein